MNCSINELYRERFRHAMTFAVRPELLTCFFVVLMKETYLLTRFPRNFFHANLTKHTWRQMSKQATISPINVCHSPQFSAVYIILTFNADYTDLKDFM